MSDMSDVKTEPATITVSGQEARILFLLFSIFQKKSSILKIKILFLDYLDFLRRDTLLAIIGHLAVQTSTRTIFTMLFCS